MPLFWREGFLGTRASFMLDFVSVAMAAVLVLLAVSIFLVRQRRRYRAHQRFQLPLVSALAVTGWLFYWLAFVAA